jgi:spore maturation protein CgeB
MRIVYFTHSLRSCWNHGNAHFLRGVLSELVARGHDVRVLEPEGAWSLANLLKDHGPGGLARFHEHYPELSSRTYSRPEEGAAHAFGADLVIVHEWNGPELVAAVGRVRRRGGRFTLLFHDTHHRAVSAPEEMRAYDLDAYDGVLAFGATLARVYERWGWRDRVFTWHEAADVRRFRPPVNEGTREGLVWIGNWGDGERSGELADFLLKPARDAELPLDIYGVRYPQEAKRTLAQYGAR